MKFDPSDDCVATEAHRRKKAATLGKGRAKKLKVVVLKEIPSSIPKGSQRDSLKRKGRIMDLSFHRCMTSKETVEHISNAFKDLGNVDNLQFLQAHRDNTLRVADKQELDGVGVIKLAANGSLYLKQSDYVVAVTNPTKSPESEAQSSSSVATNSVVNKDQAQCSNVPLHDPETQKVIRLADEIVSKLRVSPFVGLTGDFVHTCMCLNSCINVYLLG